MRNEEYQGFEPVDYDMDELLELDKQDPSTLSASQRLNLANGKASFMRRYNRLRLDRENSVPLNSQHDLLLRQARTIVSRRPSYDRANRELTIAGFKIKFALYSDGDIVCKKLFWGGKPVKHPVENGEMKLLLGISGGDRRQDNRALYSKIDSINLTITKQTGIVKFLVVSNKKLWFNPDHQDLYL